MNVLRICSVPLALLGYKTFFKELGAKDDVNLSIATSNDELFQKLTSKDHYNVCELEIKREINIFADIASILNAVKLLLRLKPSIVHSNTPKGGLISAISSYLCRTPVRIHTFTGQRWVTLKGVKRFLLIWADKLIIKLNTHLLADSKSQADFLNKHFKTNKVICLGEGSFGGIDLEKFSPSIERTLMIRDSLGYQDDDFVILYLGRVTKDKGIHELISSFVDLNKKYPNLKLLLVGPYEKKLDPLDENVEAVMLSHPHIKTIDFTDEPEKYFSACDVFCLPSYREGFGTVIIEAAAMSKASIGSDIYGISDAIIDNETGWLVKPRSVVELREKIRYTYLNRQELKQTGERALARARNSFDSGRVCDDLVEFYRRCLNEKGL
tara:strand:+ start:1537 stop:2682 length:1146 start_codon:yes stop_codon:yes gene_type:complete